MLTDSWSAGVVRAKRDASPVPKRGFVLLWAPRPREAACQALCSTCPKPRGESVERLLLCLSLLVPMRRHNNARGIVGEVTKNAVLIP